MNFWSPKLSFADSFPLKGITLEIQSMFANPIWVLPIMTVQCTLYTVKRQMWPLRRRIKGDHSHWWCLFTKCWFCFGALLCPDMVIPWHGMIWHAMLAMVCYCAVFSPPYVDKQEDFPPAVTKPSSNRSPPHHFTCSIVYVVWFSGSCKLLLLRIYSGLYIYDEQFCGCCSFCSMLKL